MTISSINIPDQKGLRVIVRGWVRGASGGRMIQKVLKSARHHELVFVDLSKATRIDRQAIAAIQKWKAENPDAFQKVRVVNPSLPALRAFIGPAASLGIPIEIG